MLLLVQVGMHTLRSLLASCGGFMEQLEVVSCIVGVLFSLLFPLPSPPLPSPSLVGIPELPAAETYWIKFALATAFLLFCGVVCLIGAGLFAKASSVIFLCVMVAIASIMVSSSWPVGQSRLLNSRICICLTK